MNKLYYRYTDIHNLIIKSSDEIKLFNPDLIIAIGGGGFIPARILRSLVDVPIYSVTLKLYNKDDEINDKVEVIQWLDLDLSNKRVVIVDEVDDTRKTLSFCLNKLKQKNNIYFNKTCVYVIHNKNKPKLGELDNSIKYISSLNVEDKWIVYPWDIALMN